MDVLVWIFYSAQEFFRVRNISFDGGGKLSLSVILFLEFLVLSGTVVEKKNQLKLLIDYFMSAGNPQTKLVGP